MSYNASLLDQAKEITKSPVKADSEPVFIKTASMLDNTPVEWLVPEWIPKRGIILLGSDGGVGKTFVWVSILASLSRGESTFLRYDPEMTEKKKVLCISGEDPENILRERLTKAGADLDYIYSIAQDTETQEPITFDSEYLERVIRTCKPALVVFDPLQSFLDGSVDMSRRNQMRQAIKPLAVLSSQYDMPVIIVMHTNKRDTDGRNKLADSSDMWDIARSVMMCGFTESGERYISLEKSSYTDHTAVHSIIFDLKGGKVNFCRTSDMKMYDFVTEKKQAKAEKVNTKRNDCCTEILRLLAENGGTYNSNELTADLQEMEFTKATIRRAKQELIQNKHIFFKRDNSGNVTYFRKNPKEHHFSPLKE